MLMVRRPRGSGNFSLASAHCLIMQYRGIRVAYAYLLELCKGQLLTCNSKNMPVRKSIDCQDQNKWTTITYLEDKVVMVIVNLLKNQQPTED